MDEAAARKVAQALIGVLVERRGFPAWWDSLDFTTKGEVMDDLAKAAMAHGPQVQSADPRNRFPRGCTVRDANGNTGVVVDLRQTSAGWRVVVRALGGDWAMAPERLERVDSHPLEVG